MKLGVITDCFKKGVEQGIITASKLGLKGVQIYATTGEFSPETLTEQKIEEYKKSARFALLQRQAARYERRRDDSDRRHSLLQ